MLGLGNISGRRCIDGHERLSGRVLRPAGEFDRHPLDGERHVLDQVHLRLHRLLLRSNDRYGTDEQHEHVRATHNARTRGSPACAANGCIFSGDQQFYVSQETEYVSHELQFFNDWTDSLTTTTGLFYYQAAISRRGDFYNANNASKFNADFNYAAAVPLRRPRRVNRLRRIRPAAAEGRSVHREAIWSCREEWRPRRGLNPSDCRVLLHRCRSTATRSGSVKASGTGPIRGDRIAHGPITTGYEPRVSDSHRAGGVRVIYARAYTRSTSTSR